MNKRLTSLAAKLEENGMKSCLLTDENDIFYYSGYRPTSQSFIFVKDGEAKLFASRLENEAEKISSIDVVFLQKIAGLKKYLGGRKIAFDEQSMPSYLYLLLRKGHTLKPSSGIIKSVRAAKDSGEIHFIEKAIRETAAIYNSLDTRNQTEIGIAGQISRSALEKGLGLSFPPIIASGRNTAFIHHRPDKTPVRENQSLLIDLGAKFNGYCADITRTVYQGRGRKMRRILEDVSEIQMSIIDSIRPGDKFPDLQKRYERLMKRKGCTVMHSIGHSIGLEVHEPAEILRQGVVITVEPGIYIKGIGGARIEDMVLVTNGKPKIMSKGLFREA
ncbi:MAG: aminopeptidase P family protein [Candidatus Aenigmarchaeota archaeon]|nr:aminopeptidase P family protein [Candidatus Aenigmarchaeota archaeon]